MAKSRTKVEVLDVLETGSPILDEAPAALEDAAHVVAAIDELASAERADLLPQEDLAEIVADLLEHLDELRAFALRVLA